MKKTRFMVNEKLRTLAGMFAIAALAAAYSAAPAAAQDGREKFIDPSDVEEAETGELLSFSTRLGLYSDYIWRGINLYKGVSIQPSMGVFYDTGDFGTVGGSIWMHIPGDNNQGVGNDKFFELDATLSYDYTWENVTFSVGHIWYTDPGYGEKEDRPEIAPDSSEFYAGFSLDMLLNPQFTFYTDYRTLEYQYYSLGFSHTFKPSALGEGFNITPFVTFGFASSADDDKIIYNHDGLEHINVGLSSSLPLGIFTVKPVATYVFGTDRDRDLTIQGQTFNLDGRTVDKFYVGFDLVYDFGI